MHAGYVEKQKVVAEHVDIFVQFAKEAAAGKKRMLISHSEIVPGTYACTTETADYLLEKLQLPRQAMAAFAVKARDLGVDFIGSCCGSVAAHVRAMAQALGKVPIDEGEWRVDYDRPMSAFEYYRHEA